MEEKQADIKELKRFDEEGSEEGKISSGEKTPGKWRYIYILTAFGISAFLTIMIMWVFLARHSTINHLKSEILRIQNSLNEVNWDIAYEDLEFSIWYPKNIMSVRNVKLYSWDAQQKIALEIPKIIIKSDFFDPQNLSISFDDEPKLETASGQYNLFVPKARLDIRFDDTAGLRQLTLTAEDFQIKNMMSIGTFQMALMQMAPMNIRSLSPAWETYIQAEDIKFDKPFKSNLSDKIEKVYLNANVIGKPSLNDSYRGSIYDWLEIGGYLDIKSLVLNWKPLSLVGRGSLYFNEKLVPNLHLETSSKALPDIMTYMLKEKWMDSKGVFVSKILLRNKAFKLDPTDEYLAVLAPIDYKDQKLQIENITVLKTSSDK